MTPHPSDTPAELSPAEAIAAEAQRILAEERAREERIPVRARELSAGVIARAEADGLVLDAAQLAALEPLSVALAAAVEGRPGAGGFYLWGAVGRGKTWLLDAYAAQLPAADLRRVHFHDFFRELELATATHFPRAGAGAAALEDVLRGVSVLAFDEFHVHDVGDAKLFIPFLESLAERGITLILSSNYAPEGLLPHENFHDLFEDSIRLLDARLAVVEIGQGKDFRADAAPAARATGFAAGTWTTLERPTAPDTAEPALISAGGHHFTVRAASADTLRFGFAELMVADTSVSDLLVWADRYPTWIVQDVPALAEANPRAQQRFVNLVDVLVDRDRTLHVQALVPRAAFTEGVDLPTDITRTISRLGLLGETPRG